MNVEELAVVVLASFAGALVKAVTGMGYPLIAVPLIAIVLGVEDAVVLVALPNFAANLYLNFESRDARAETRDLDRLVGFGVVGAVVGTVALVELPEEPLLIGLAAMIVVFIMVFLTHPELSISPRTARRASPLVGTVTGLAQGAVGVSGPIVATWVHGYRLSPRGFVNQVTFIFGVTGLTQVVILGIQGQFTAERLTAALVAAVPVALAIPVGLHLRRRLAGAAFERVVLAVLIVSAVALLVQALA